MHELLVTIAILVVSFRFHKYFVSCCFVFCFIPFVVTNISYFIVIILRVLCLCHLNGTSLLVYHFTIVSDVRTTIRKCEYFSWIYSFNGEKKKEFCIVNFSIKIIIMFVDDWCNAILQYAQLLESKMKWNKNSLFLLLSISLQHFRLFFWITATILFITN